jgi:hypothetical protein
VIQRCVLDLPWLDYFCTKQEPDGPCRMREARIQEAIDWVEAKLVRSVALHDIDWVHIAAAERWYYRSTVPNSPGVSDRGCCALKATCRLLRPPAVPLWDF